MLSGKVDLARTIVEQPEVEQMVNDLTQKYPRFEEQWKGLTWLISRAPEENSIPAEAGRSVVRLIHRSTPGPYRLPSVAALFTYDEQEVIVYAVNVFMDNE